MISLQEKQKERDTARQEALQIKCLDGAQVVGILEDTLTIQTPGEVEEETINQRLRKLNNQDREPSDYNDCYPEETQRKQKQERLRKEYELAKNKKPILQKLNKDRAKLLIKRLATNTKVKALDTRVRFANAIDKARETPRK